MLRHERTQKFDLNLELVEHLNFHVLGESFGKFLCKWLGSKTRRADLKKLAEFKFDTCSTDANVISGVIRKQVYLKKWIDTRIPKALSMPVWILVSEPHVKGLRRQQDHTIHWHTSDKKRENGRWEGRKNSAKVRICRENGNESKEGRIFFIASRRTLSLQHTDLRRLRNVVKRTSPHCTYKAPAWVVSSSQACSPTRASTCLSGVLKYTTASVHKSSSVQFFAPKMGNCEPQLV